MKKFFYLIVALYLCVKTYAAVLEIYEFHSPFERTKYMP